MDRLGSTGLAADEPCMQITNCSWYPFRGIEPLQTTHRRAASSVQRGIKLTFFPSCTVKRYLKFRDSDQVGLNTVHVTTPTKTGRQLTPKYAIKLNLVSFLFRSPGTALRLAQPTLLEINLIPPIIELLGKPFS